MKPKPIKEIAAKIQRHPEVAKRLARAGKLRAWKDASGHWWSDDRAAMEFMGFTVSANVVRDEQEALEALR